MYYSVAKTEITAVTRVFLLYSFKQRFLVEYFFIVQVKIAPYACWLWHGTGQETLLLLHADFSLTLIPEWIDYSEEENERETLLLPVWA